MSHGTRPVNRKAVQGLSVEEQRIGKQSVARIGNEFGLVAQLVEQRTENPCVGGSIPPQATRFLAALRDSSH